MSLLKRIELSVCIALIFSGIFSVFSFADTSEKIRNDVLRLHVIANSDSEIDQNLKLKVRDALLQSGSEIFNGSICVEDAINKITPEIPYLESVAKTTIEKNGFDYNVKITIDREYFNTRTYDYVTLPAGVYTALRVIIGTGEGHNWWCVMFPAMCLPSAEKNTEIRKVLTDDEVQLMEHNPHFEPRFKVIEIIENVKHKLKG